MQYTKSTKKIRRKSFQEQNVLDAAYERMRYIFRSFDKVVVSFSGGKDSTAVLNVAADVAKEFNKLPLEVVFFDEEVITPPTVDYCLRVAKRPELNFRWMCVELKQRNACSFEEPYWYTWDAAKKDVWVRQLPEKCETYIPTYKKDIEVETGVADAFTRLWSKKDGKVCVVTGVRTEESMRRYRMMAQLTNDNYINVASKGKDHNIFSAHPVYDWRSSDIWLAVKQLGWDYNRTYDIFNLTNLHGKYLHQRVCVPFGEEAMRGFDIYQECFPEFWAKICKRVLGVGSAVRYANAELYGAGLVNRPDGMTWRDYLYVVLQSYQTEEYNLITKGINESIKLHYKKSTLPIEDDDPDPISGASWFYFCKVAMKGDFKLRWLGNINNQSIKSKRAKGLTFDEIVEKYATESFKSTWSRKSAGVAGVLDTPQPD